MFDIAIIGAGPAGASAAIFAARAKKSTLLLDDDKGVTRRALLRNHYGVAEITGPELVELGKRQAAASGAEVVAATVQKVVRTGGHLVIETASGRYEARHVILASGMSTELAAASGLVTDPGIEPRVKTIVRVGPSGETSVPGVWAAGTVAGTSMHTIVTAGDGARVAINVVSDLNGARWVDHDVLPAR